MKTLQKMKKSAKPVSSVKVRRAWRQLETLPVQIERNKEISSSLFGIEAHAKEKLAAELTALEKQRDQVQHLANLGSRYSVLNMKHLLEYDKFGHPKLVIYRLTSPIFSYATEGKKLRPRLPKQLKACYKGWMEYIESVSDFDNEHMIISTEFTGVIPHDVKEKIKEAYHFFGKEIFIIAEPGEFKITRTMKQVHRTFDPDPLVVGWDGQLLWLIAAFDLTTVEKETLEKSL